MCNFKTSWLSFRTCRFSKWACVAWTHGACGCVWLDVWWTPACHRLLGSHRSPVGLWHWSNHTHTERYFIDIQWNLCTGDIIEQISTSVWIFQVNLYDKAPFGTITKCLESLFSSVHMFHCNAIIPEKCNVSKVCIYSSLRVVLEVHNLNPPFTHIIKKWSDSFSPSEWPP